MTRMTNRFIGSGMPNLAAAPNGRSKIVSASSWSGERVRLARWRWHPAIADFPSPLRRGAGAPQPSLVAECDDRVDSHRATRRNETGEERRRPEQQYDCAVSQQIGCPNPEEQRAKQTSRREGAE